MAATEKAGIEVVGNIAFVKPGIRPIMLGPRMMPVRTSAMTRGWRSFERGKWRSRVRMITIPAWYMKTMIGFLES